MFEDLQKIAESQSQKEKFRSSANKLLNKCFILKRKEDTRKDYIFIRDNKDLFIEYLDMIGYELFINENLGFIYIKNQQGTGKLFLSKMQSIFLLILRLLYLEKRNDISTSSEERTVKMQEIRSKFDMLKLNTKLDKTTEKDALAIFKRYNIIRIIDSDITQEDARIEIYPSVLMAISDDGINALYEQTKNRLEEYESGVEDNAEDDAD